jgi:hypothetical protein
MHGLARRATYEQAMTTNTRYIRWAAAMLTTCAVALAGCGGAGVDPAVAHFCSQADPVTGQSPAQSNYSGSVSACEQDMITQAKDLNETPAQYVQNYSQ